MAIEVTKRGTPRSDRPCEFSCRECGSEMRATIKDGTYVSDQRDGDAVKFRCPVCREEIWVAASKFRGD